MNNTTAWYQSVIKPSFSPPSYVFGIAWGILYPLIFISFGYVFYLFLNKKISFKILLPFILNLIFNLLYSPIQFVLQNNYLASLDISLLLITLVWGMRSIYKYKKIISYVQIPYLLWILFATVLQFSITYLNR